jgi:hypothetical protein
MLNQSQKNRRSALDELPTYIFRGDKLYRGGPVGIPFNSEHARAADIQNPAEHVLRKEPGNIYTSFTTRLSAAERFGELRWILKVDVASLRQLEAEGAIRLFLPGDVYDLLKESGKRLAKEAGPTRDYMMRNGEILVEGQMPASLIRRVKRRRSR